MLVLTLGLQLVKEEVKEEVKDKTTPVEKKGGEKDETTTVSKDKKELVDTTSEENKDDNANVENKLSGEELKVVSKENKKGKNCLPC